MADERKLFVLVEIFALRVGDIVHLAFLDGFVVARQSQQTLVESPQLTLRIGHLAAVELALVRPCLQALDAPVVEDGRPAVNAAETFHIHAALA